MSYLSETLKSAGLSIDMAANTPQGGMVMAEDSGKNRLLMITAISSTKAPTSA
jgi:hypothetical protein